MNKEDYMRILFITHSNIGDAILSTILLDRLLNDFPEATFDIACGARAVELFKGFPNLGDLVPVIKKKRHAHHFDMWKKFRQHEYEYVVDLRGSLLPYFLKKKNIIRFSNSNKNLHKAQQLSGLYPSDLPVKQKIWLDETVVADVRKKATKLKEEGPLLGFGPTSNWRAKTWPQRKFALLTNMIHETPGFENARFVLFGAEHERRDVEDLINYIPAEKRIDLIGQTSLTEAAAWMQELDIFLGHDSGLSHLAAALDVPCVTLFGPTPEHLYAPVTEKGRLVIAQGTIDLNLRSDAPKRLITDIQPETVYEAFVDIYNKYNNVEQQKEKELVRA